MRGRGGAEGGREEERKIYYNLKLSSPSELSAALETVGKVSLKTKSLL